MLKNVVCGDMIWVLVSNYMVDFRWLLSACPDLKKAGEVLLVHGEKSPELYVSKESWFFASPSTAESDLQETGDDGCCLSSEQHTHSKS